MARRATQIFEHLHTSCRRTKLQSSGTRGHVGKIVDESQQVGHLSSCEIGPHQVILLPLAAFAIQHRSRPIGRLAIAYIAYFWCIQWWLHVADHARAAGISDAGMVGGRLAVSIAMIAALCRSGLAAEAPSGAASQG